MNKVIEVLIVIKIFNLSSKYTKGSECSKISKVFKVFSNANLTSNVVGVDTKMTLKAHPPTNHLLTTQNKMAGQSVT